jgi:carbamoyl-phosphate synthase large subunit
MPKRTDIQSILIIGAGPIVIGQACEFDYSGTQACQALKAEGYRVILVNSNPATIMTDPGIADATYIEPITWEVVEKIIAKEKPDVILPTMGGQTALNCALDLASNGVLEKYGVEMIGASREAIDKAEDRQLFDQAMKRIGLQTPRSGIAHSMEEAWLVLEEVGFPAIIRPSFTMGGSGGGIAYNRDEFRKICMRGLDLSPTNELLIDESVIGWKEYELEMVRDCADNCIVVCSIENIDPMGVHTGDSITVAPAQTLTDKEYQRMRDAAIAILREIGVDTGGSNVQFAVNPENGELLIVEMNPRVSRSSALASKATGFPIAKVAALLSIGYTLNELRNEITGGKMPASFEPTLDYVVCKIPRFDFKKFKGCDATLSTQMKSVGEVMAIGRNFPEALQKAIRGLETDKYGLESSLPAEELRDEEFHNEFRRSLRIPVPHRLWMVADAFRLGYSQEDVHEKTGIDPWFLVYLHRLVELEKTLTASCLTDISKDEWVYLKQQGFADKRIAELMHISEQHVRNTRHEMDVRPVYKRVDTCAGEFPTQTDYFYSTYEEQSEYTPTDKEKIIVLGGGPNRIGQGIEFDYCCVHAAFAMRDCGYEAIMINCNPETVSTDFDCSDRLYFEPLTMEDVLEIVAIEKPKGVIVQFGGQTPLKLANGLAEAGVPIIGTSPESIDRAEDREAFGALIDRLELLQPRNGTVRSVEEGIRLAKVLAYPLIVRPSFVLGGRAMEVIYHERELVRYMQQDVVISPGAPLLLDQFLDHAVEIDIDAVCDGKDVLIGGILEHIEQAGVHSGDSACAFPAHSLSADMQNKMRDMLRQLALSLQVVGLVNAQFAILNDEIYVLEVNPRASRTVPFLAKATGVPLAQIAAKCMVGCSLQEQGYTKELVPPYVAVKKPVFPFTKFHGTDPILGPEMRSTGEAMGLGSQFGIAFANSLLADDKRIPRGGQAFVSVRESDKVRAIPMAKRLLQAGFTITATRGTATALQSAGVDCDIANKVGEGRPDIVDQIKNKEIQFVVNTVEGEGARIDSGSIRRSAVQHKVCYTTTLAGAEAVCMALEATGTHEVLSLQELHPQVKTIEELA